jgi:ASC-1-like (ASCH) protein
MQSKDKMIRELLGAPLMSRYILPYIMASTASTKLTQAQYYDEPMSPVQGDWFTEIFKGRKTVEGRASCYGKYHKWLGKIIRLRGTDERSIIVRIINIRHYLDLDSYIEGEGWQKIAPHMYSNESTKEAYMNIWMPDSISRVFSSDRVMQRGGINAVELEIVIEPSLMLS